jgi:choline dehydrogenase-like flavoprotein
LGVAAILTNQESSWPSRENLTLVTKARVLRVVVEKGKATGVEYAVGNSATALLARCGGELIVTSGAIGSPRLLLLSGIGPADELKALGIDVSHDLPGVGKNFQDHLNSYVVSDLKEPVSYDGADQFPRSIVHGIQYVLFKTGPVTSVVAESGCFLSSKEGGRPDIQMHILPAYVVNSGRTKVKGYGFTVNTVVSRPESRGSVTLATKDPAAMPVIDPNYHSVAVDRALSIQGIRKAREILAQSELARHVARERFPGPGLTTDSEILDYIRQYASVDYHAVGTCKMGVDENAVVDPELRVRGIDGLRVIDSSIMPTLISGNTNATSIMIGEKGAAIILKETPLVADLTVAGRQKVTKQLEASQ